MLTHFRRIFAAQIVRKNVHTDDDSLSITLSMKLTTRSTRTYAFARESLNVHKIQRSRIGSSVCGSKNHVEANELCALFDGIAVC